MILSGLLQQAGGQIVLTEGELGEVSDQIVIDVQEKAGIVTLTLIPDYVVTGREEDNAGQAGQAIVGSGPMSATWLDVFVDGTIGPPRSTLKFPAMAGSVIKP